MRPTRRSAPSRRSFLATALAGGAATALGDLAFLGRLAPVGAAEARLDPKAVRMRPEIEPLVRLLEETPRERLLEEIASRIRRGLTYREILAALLLAGVRNVQPRPYVGFKFHAVLVVNSAHLASLASPDHLRWLPIFWALDYFKSAQAQDASEGDWTMAPVDEKAVPPPHRARAAFIEAMEAWDAPAADAAVAGLARSAGAQEIFELMFRFGARDFRSIGHKGIFVANSQRTLGAIGWQHAEPVLRSLAYALQNHRGTANPVTDDSPADRPWRRNVELARRMKKDWRGGTVDAGATAALLDVLRTGDWEDASHAVADTLGRGVAPRSVQDALFQGAAELVMRKPGIMSLHAATTTNALQHAFRTSGDDETRRLLLLQNAAFLPLFRAGAIERGGELAKATIDALEPADPPESGGKSRAPAGEIFALLGSDRGAAARKALAFLARRGERGARELIDAGRVLVFLKGNDAHDYKYSSAVLEDFHHMSPAAAPRFLAASLFLLHGSGERDNPLVERTREAFRAPARRKV